MSKKKKKVDLVIQNPCEIVTARVDALPVKGTDLSRLEVLENFSIVVDKGKIVDITNTLDAYEPANVFDATGLIALPGFVDAHTHIPFFGFRYEEFLARAAGADYLEILKSGGGILSTREAVKRASFKEMVDFNLRFLNEMLSCGITTADAKTGYGLENHLELKQLDTIEELNRIQPVELIPTFMGAHAVPPEFSGRSREYLEKLLEISNFIKKCVSTVDIFCERGAFSVEDTRFYLENMKHLGFRIRLHADEFEDFGCARLGLEIGAVSVDHLIASSDETLKALASSSTTAVFMPATSFFMKKPYARARTFIDLGGAVALGSDFNPGSNTIFDPTFIVHLAVNHLGMTVEESIHAYTINAAWVLGVSEKTGSIEKGKAADIILLDLPSYKAIPYLPTHRRVRAVFKNGQLVWAEANAGKQ
ncbi:MAG: imidazolonepropionase [Thermotogota bacterium]|nr:imidazolonepropionase [Thermotogota bacterium]MDK2864754.1 imidazolonepropionase [Thermotogota bacterium]